MLRFQRLRSVFGDRLPTVIEDGPRGAPDANQEFGQPHEGASHLTAGRGRYQRIRAINIWPDLEVILTSGYSVDLAGREFKAPKHVHFLPKPYSATQLINAARLTLDVNGRHGHGPPLAS